MLNEVVDGGKLLDEILIKKKQMGSMSDAAFKSKEEKMFKEEMTKIQYITRSINIQTYYYSNEYPLSTSMTLDQFIQAFSQPYNQLYNLITNPQFTQSLTHGILFVYTHPEQFATAVIGYFKENPKDINIFSHMVFPAIYGFFLSKEQTQYGFDFLVALYNNGEFDFATPFFQTFLSSSFLFLDTFWRSFFELLGKSRYKPSIAQLAQILVTSLKTNIRYFTPFHVQLCFQIILMDAEYFCRVFFEEFLRTEFDQWILNPSVATTKIHRNQMLLLFKNLSPSANNSIFNQIQEAFFENNNAFSFCEYIPFIGSSSRNRISCLLSPYEARLLTIIISSIPSGDKGKVPTMYPISKITDSFETFVPGTFDLYFDKLISKVPAEMENLLFNNRTIDVHGKTDDTIREWTSLSLLCKEKGVDPFKVLMEATKEDSKETMEMKIVKKKAKKHISEDEKLYVLTTTYNELVNRENAFEQFLLGQHQAQQLADMKRKIHDHGEIVERYLALQMIGTQYSRDSKLFPNQYLRLQMEIDETNPQLIELKRNQEQFDNLIFSYSKDDARYNEFLRKSRVYLIASACPSLSKIDELSLGESYYVICGIFSSIREISELNEWNGPLFISVLQEAKTKSFFAKFLSYCRFESTHVEDMKALKPHLKESWEELRKFLIGFINESKELDQSFKSSIYDFIR